jgi:hypothetical protein
MDKTVRNIAIGAAALLATMAVFSKPNRFLGDRAKKGDQIEVPVTALGSLPNALPPDATSVTIFVDDDSNLDTLTGPITGATAVVNGQKVVSAVPTGDKFTVARKDVTSVMRDGKPVQ